MTIAQLLSHHGHKAPRWVDVDGQVVFDASAAAKPLTAMAPHTFHGGDDPEDVGDSASGSWWSHEAEMARHVDSVSESFSGFHYLPAEDDAPPAFGGLINTGRGTFKVLVMMRRDGGLPFVSVVGPRLGRVEGRTWRKPPHLYVSGALCVADQGDWRRGEHTAATAILWAAHWLAAYTEWRFTGRWPIEGYEPNAA